VNVPEPEGHTRTTSFDDPAKVDGWAARGWIDLRPRNMETWLKRLRKMVGTRTELRDAGSAAASISTYLPVTFEIGEVVAWIFANEIGGYRIK